MWWQNAVIYQTYVDAFAKDFRGLIDNLDYLSTLKVNAIWIMPHYPSPMIDGGYDVSDYLAVRSNLGTLADFTDFVNAAHQKGIKVIIDWVINHTSTTHLWFESAVNDPEGQYRNYYLWSKTGEEFAEGINAFPQIKQSNWVYEPKTNEYYYSTFYPKQADLNYDNPAVIAEMEKYLRFWCDLNVDGFRVDAVPHMVKREGTNCKHQPGVHTLLKHFRTFIDTNYSDRVLLGEATGEQSKAEKYFGNGDEFQLLLNFAEAAEIIASLINDNFTVSNHSPSQLPKGCAWANMLTSHDGISIRELPADLACQIAEKLDPEGTLTYVPNEALAMRLATALNGDPAKIRQAWQKTFNLPGAVVIYAGEELGLKNREFNYLVNDKREYVRGDFPWEDARAQMVNGDSLYVYVRGLIGEKLGLTA